MSGQVMPTSKVQSETLFGWFPAPQGDVPTDQPTPEEIYVNLHSKLNAKSVIETEQLKKYLRLYKYKGDAKNRYDSVCEITPREKHSKANKSNDNVNESYHRPVLKIPAPKLESLFAGSTIQANQTPQQQKQHKATAENSFSQADESFTMRKHFSSDMLHVRGSTLVSVPNTGKPTLLSAEHEQDNKKERRGAAARPKTGVERKVDRPEGLRLRRAKSCVQRNVSTNEEASPSRQQQRQQQQQQQQAFTPLPDEGGRKSQLQRDTSNLVDYTSMYEVSPDEDRERAVQSVAMDALRQERLSRPGSTFRPKETKTEETYVLKEGSWKYDLLKRAHSAQRPVYYRKLNMETPLPQYPHVHHNVPETYFTQTIPVRKRTYVIDPNFISEHLIVTKLQLNSNNNVIKYGRDYAFVY